MARGFAGEQFDPEVREGIGFEGVRRAFARLADLRREHGFDLLVFGPMAVWVTQICRDLDLPYYNTLEEIPPGRYPEEYNIHGLHPRKAGHRVLAKHLEQVLTRERLLREGVCRIGPD